MAARKARSARRFRARGWDGGQGQMPRRLLAVLAVAIAALYATMFATGNLKPRLAIDLAGGTSVVYQATPEKGGTITQSAMSTAVTIMQARANGYGVTDASVTQEGSNTIQAELPGENSQQVVQELGKTALLYFRPVLNEAQGTAASPSPSASGSASSSASPSASASTSAASSASASASSSASAQSESMSLKQDAASSPSASTAASTSAAASSSPSASASPSASSSAPTETTSQTAADAAFSSLVCTTAAKQNTAYKNAAAQPSTDYVVSCDSQGIKYELGPSLVSGTDVTSAQATTVQAQGTATGAWQVVLNFDKKGAGEFSTATQQLYSEYQSQSGSGQFAIVLDGQVISAPVVNQGAITGGTAQITGSTITQSYAQQLATQLNYGHLPLTFSTSDIAIVSPTLGGSELQGGLIAGAIGLILVFGYVFLYYRGLAVVAISSLVIAGALTYSLAVLLGPLMGFTLSLEGIAGLIVAIGITADSFVVFFERLRDEVREGRTLRTAVEHGWRRARRTIVASDLVSILAAVVLYVMSIGTVKGFAFTLGLSTVIDLVVVFMFTKPMITLLAHTEFFGGGHKWSGLDPERLGGKRVAWTAGPAAPAGRRMTIAERRRAAEAGEAPPDEGRDETVSDDTKRVDA